MEVLASPMDNPNQERNQIENWARRVLGKILYVADSALVPNGNGLDRELKDKSQLADLTTYHTEFDELRVKGTRTFLVEDVNRLEQCRFLLQQSFNSLSTEFTNNGMTASQKEHFFGRLGEVINAAYHIGAYTTITDRIHEAVSSLNWREHAASLRQRKVLKNINSEKAGKREVLRDAVRFALANHPGKHGRYHLIRQRVGAAKKDTWPSKSTVERMIQKLRDENEKAPQS